MSANLPRYGSYVAHLGIVVLFAGIAGSAWNQSRELEFTLHQSVVVGPYRVECSGYTHQSGLNYDSDYVLLDVYRGHQKVSHLVPERRVYIASGQPMTVVANYSKLSSDLYIIYAGKEPDTQHPILKVFLNPLVQWVWIGMGVVIFGGIISLFSARDNVRTTRASHLTSIIRYRAMEVFPAEESCPSVVERDASPSVFAAQEGE